METPTLEDLARLALEGDRDAVAGVVRGLQGPIYALAIRMLWQPEDAEDATQEILVRVITRLSQFDFRSRLSTWAYRVATNYLLDVKKSCVEERRLDFVSFGEDLAEGLSDEGPAESERSRLLEEVKIGCTLGMLQCLDRVQRAAYVLGEILDIPAPEAAQALGVEPATFRKRLSRARATIEEFTRAHCGLASEEAACRCHRRVPAAVRLGRARPDALRFARDEASFEEVRAYVGRVERTKRALEVHRSSSPRGSERDFMAQVASALHTGRDPTLA